MLTNDKRIYVAAAGDQELCLLPRMGNRHGLVAGATGTGKTVTLQTLAEGFSSLGVPVFLTDVKGDLAGISQAGAPQGSIAARIEDLGLRDKGYANRGFPVCFWALDEGLGAPKGHPLRATVSDMGPLLLSRLLDLNDVQSGIMSLIFRIADDQGLLLLDLKDLRSMTAWVGENRRDFLQEYGQISPSSIGAIQRGLVRLEEEGADRFFGEPALHLEDLLQSDLSGRGVINILEADSLLRRPKLYASLLLWLLSELFEQLPEVGDAERPRLILMFDEAHLLFRDMPSVLLEKVEQVVRLIRSKGVGVYFITQNPTDLPSPVLGQLGNRVQHALRAFTPADRKAVRAAAQTFRANPQWDAEEAISALATGEALVSFLDAKGAPQMVEHGLILPPEGRVGPISDEERRSILAASRQAGRYDTAVDRESAYELLSARFAERQRAEDEAKRLKEEAKQAKEAEKQRREAEREALRQEREARRQARENPNLLGQVFQDVTRQARRTVTNSVGRQIGNTILRGVLGSLFGGKK